MYPIKKASRFSGQALLLKGKGKIELNKPDMKQISAYEGMSSKTSVEL